jgi:hypothetical protein
MAVVPKPNDGTKGLSISSNPTAAALLEVGMHQVYEPPHSSKFDIVECAVSGSECTHCHDRNENISRIFFVMILHHLINPGPS